MILVYEPRCGIGPARARQRHSAVALGAKLVLEAAPCIATETIVSWPTPTITLQRSSAAGSRARILRARASSLGSGANSSAGPTPGSNRSGSAALAQKAASGRCRAACGTQCARDTRLCYRDRALRSCVPSDKPRATPAVARTIRHSAHRAESASRCAVCRTRAPRARPPAHAVADDECLALAAALDHACERARQMIESRRQSNGQKTGRKPAISRRRRIFR